MLDKEDKKYLKNIDPTIYQAYLKWDQQNAKDFGRSAAEMYVDSVITRSKNLEYGHKLEDVEMPGKITVDIGYHMREHNKRPDDVQGFRKLKNLIASHRANRILKNHSEKNMDLATVKDNRWKFRGTITALLASAGIGAVALTQGNSQRSDSVTPDDGKVVTTDDGKFITPDDGRVVTPDDAKVVTADDGTMKGQDTNNQKEDTQNENKRNQAQNKQDKSNRLYPGDLASPEQFAMIFSSSDGKQADGAIGNTNQTYGVNKMAVVIGDAIYTTDQYSPDELYDMAENNANASIKWHVDKAVEMNGRMVVETHQVGNPSPIYVYNDNGVIRTVDGKEWNGDVEYGVGWVDNEKLTKVEQPQTQQQSQTQQHTQERTQEDLER